jgi:type 1 glutamine amidotransferase
MTFRSIIVTSLTVLHFSFGAMGEPPKRLLLVGQGPDGHPPQTHEYVAGLEILHKLLTPIDGLKIERVRADEPWKEGPELIERADGVVLFLCEGAKWASADPSRLAALLAMAKRGGGLVGLHWGIGTKDAKNIDEFLKLLGGCHGGPDRKYQVLQAEVTSAEHAIASGIKPFSIKEEFYYKLKFAKDGKLQPVLRAKIDGADETVAWAWERPDGGRSFGFSGLHFHENWKNENYQRLVAQGVLWSMKREVPKDGLKVP